MAWVSYRADGTEHVGVVEGRDVVPLTGISCIDATTDLEQLLNARPDDRGRTPLSEVELLPASPRPRKILCVGLNYIEHVGETKREVPTYPVLFAKFASNLIPSQAEIRLPPESDEVDYEGELAVIIGRAGRRITREHAMEHVLGYSVANDVTMRDYQYKTHQWIQGKAWDHSTPLGPFIAPAGSVDLASMPIRTILNGVVVQESDLSKLIFDIPRLISDISEFTSLEPGDVILTGTPGGVGFRRHPQVFLRAGDTIVVEVDGVGRLENRVAA